MLDDLRTRIGKTLHRLYGPSLGAHPDGWDREPVGTQEMYLEDADAVIRELEAGYVLVPKNVTLVQWADEAFKGQPEGNFKHEHVTKWAADA